jgi:excisionase family DNA binding protein
MSNPRALFVRIPAAQADKLDWAARELGTPKQRLIAGLVARYVDPSTPAGLAALAEIGGPARVVVEAAPDALRVGHHSFRPAEALEVLTPEQLAELLQVDVDTLIGLAEEGDLPGRRVGGEWRFARRAVLEWIGAGEPGDPDEAG